MKNALLRFLALLLPLFLAGCAGAAPEGYQAELDKLNAEYGTELVLADIPPLEEGATLEEYREWAGHVAQCRRILDEVNADYGMGLTFQNAAPSLDWPLEDYRAWAVGLCEGELENEAKLREFGATDEVMEMYRALRAHFSAHGHDEAYDAMFHEFGRALDKTG